MFSLPVIRAHDHHLDWSGITGETSKAWILSELCLQVERPILVITHTLHEAERLQDAIQFFTGPLFPVTVFQDLEILPYDHFSPHADIISNRIGLLAALPFLKKGIIVANINTLMHCLIPKEYLMAHSMVLAEGDTIDPATMRETWVKQGYRFISQVMEPGECSIRGALLDVFPMGSPTAFRIELFDNTIETIRTFDPESQRSLKKIEKINWLPACEFSPTLFEKSSSFFDYLPNDTICIFQNYQMVLENFWREIKHRYEQVRYDTRRPLPEPLQLFFPIDVFNHQLKSFTQIELHTDHRKPHFKINTTALPTFENCEISTAPAPTRTLFCVDSPGRREALLNELELRGIQPITYASWLAFLESTTQVGIVMGPLDQGIELKDLQILIITENQIFGTQIKQRRGTKTRLSPVQDSIRHFSELRVGDPVVHFHHGVGRYRGLQTLTTANTEAEYLTLEYANQDKIYVPVGALHLISRYTGADSDHAPLQKLGTTQWDKIKKKAAEKIRDVAAELLHIYSQRTASNGYAFKPCEKDYQRFASSFPFEETPDQTAAIQDVIQDMTKARCMDRLLCGDVGFGKTEVAMRASFIAAMNHKQVAILVPTTLLATQHLENFRDRFADWPFKIAGLSRMETVLEQKKTIAGLANGTIDIVIGTHKLLSKTVQFKNLGLLIIDEEQRFGVQQKERMTALRHHLDMLTLTATPIPRTLNMALVGTRDLSIMTTPPHRRLSVKTWVHEYDESLIREAVLREIMRGGQIYFLHNEVSTIHQQAEKLKKITPEAQIAVAHGQLGERELEQVMTNFYHQRFHMLVCSTIIESGIDIPSANTIIINRADHFGLAQLHQLRGRVGRSHHQAYAYLLTPPAAAMTADAVKRLEAITALHELGGGFNLATHDLEIRGAGAFLGEEQSGHMHEIGFTLYMELLEKAVAALKAGQTLDLDIGPPATAEIDLGIPALLPADYVNDVNLRLSFYKQLANCTHLNQIQALKEEWRDRFGTLPTPAENLLVAAQLKLKANTMGIIKIEINHKFIYVYFIENPSINSIKLIHLLQSQPKIYQLQGPHKIRIAVQEKPTAIDQLTDLLRRLAA